MKTTLEISDPLFREAKAYASRHRLPFREVVELGLRQFLDSSRASRRRFRLRDGSVDGEGMAVDGNWPAIRSMIYEGRGG